MKKRGGSFCDRLRYLRRFRLGKGYRE